MSKNQCFVAGIVLFVAAPSAFGQESPDKKDEAQYRALVKFRDGSTQNVVIFQPKIKVATDYGELSVPFKQVRRIDFGLHYPEGDEQKIDDAIRLLGNEAYRERENATRYLLSAKHLAYPLLKRVSESKDNLEVTRRAAEVVRQIKDRCAPELLLLTSEDAAYATKFPIIGRVSGTQIKAHSAYFGDVVLKFSQIASIHGGANAQEKEIAIDAKEFGSSVDQWMDTHVDVSSDVRLLIRAEGQVDLWPQGPGQYLSTPKGYTTAGKGSTFMAAALSGRIGKEGKPFLIGDSYDGVPGSEGRLFFQIVPSPWNNVSTGTYHVRISTNYSLSR